MGYYIDKTKKRELSSSYEDKISGLIDDGATHTTGDRFQENLVCVVNNGPFAAAGYAFDEREFDAFANDGSRRPKTWLLYEHAAEMSGFKK